MTTFLFCVLQYSDVSHMSYWWLILTIALDLGSVK